MAGVRRSARQPRQVRPDRRARGRPRGLARAGLPSPSSTARRASCGCWSTTATTSSPSEPACRAGSAGTCTTSRPELEIRRAASQLQRVVARVAAAPRPTRRSDRRDRARACSTASANSTAASTSSNAQITPLVIRLAPSLLEHPRLRRADRRQDRRRDRRRPPLPLQERLRALERHRPATGLVGQHDPLPAQPRRQPPGQRRAAPHRDHPGAQPDPRARLPRQAHRARQHARPKRSGSCAAASPTGGCPVARRTLWTAVLPPRPLPLGAWRGRTNPRGQEEPP